MEKSLKTNKPGRKQFENAIEHGDRPWQGLLIIVSVLVVLLMAAIGYMLWKDSGQSRVLFGFKFLLPTGDPSWDPVNDDFQAWPFIFGTLLTSLAAILIALPISLGIGIFLAELCPPWLRTPLNWLVELLAAIPSVIYGLWGIFIFLPKVVTPVGIALAKTFANIPLLDQLFKGPMPASGSSRLAASLILTIMIIPTI